MCSYSNSFAQNSNNRGPAILAFIIVSAILVVGLDTIAGLPLQVQPVVRGGVQ